MIPTTYQPDPIPSPDQIANWLASVNCYDLQPCFVTIQGEKYPACRYKQDRPKLLGTDLPADTVECIKVVGMLPKCKQRSGNVCFRLEGDERDWYVCCYSGEMVPMRQALHRHHRQVLVPLGGPENAVVKSGPWHNDFQLAPWDSSKFKPGYENSKIDDYERFPYKRIPITITRLVGSTNPPMMRPLVPA
jgi:hypothetical protein